MRLFEKLILGMLAAILLISGFAILNPRAVHAAVATITRDQDNPARHPFTTFCEASSTGNNTECSTPPVPAGEEVVIETISINVQGDPTNLVAADALVVTTAGVQEHYQLNALPDSGFLQPRASSFSAVLSLRFYADPGTPITFQAQTPNTNNLLSVNLTISGYFVTLR